MANFDGTGPQGNGPKTGRGLGPCQNKAEQKNQRSLNEPRGLGQGKRFGRNIPPQKNA